MLDAGADLHARSHTDDTAITQAANIDTVRVLVQAGADINSIDGSGYGLLKSAAERGLVEFAKSLLEAGANPDTTSTGDTALHTAVCFDELVIMKDLLDHGANVNALDVDGWTPLFMAKSVESVRMLLGHGADRTVKDDCNVMARDWVAKFNEEAAEEL